MNTLAEIRSVVQSDLNVGANSSLFPSSRIDSAINRAYIKISTLFKWPSLEDSLKTSTALNEYYDFPSNWSPDSIWKLEIDGDMYGETPDGSPMDFGDYLIWKANNTNSTEKKWAVQYKRFFVYPTPTSIGDDNITIWGQKIVDSLTDDGDTTVFSYDMPQCNEALALEASAILKRKGESQMEMFSNEAKQILVIAFNHIKKEQNKYKKTQPFLNVPDYFGRRTRNKQITGNF